MEVQHNLSMIKQRLEILYQLVEQMEQNSGSGTDYTELSNKPQINSTTLTGNKSLADLGIASAAALNDKASVTDIYGIGTLIEQGTDIDNLKTAGVYTCPNITVLESLVQDSLPVLETTFRLEVKYINETTRVRQEFYPLSNTSEFYVRTLGTTNTWQSWYKFEGTEVEANGGVDA